MTEADGACDPLSPLLRRHTETGGLEPRIKQYVAAGLAENTRRAYRTDLAHFLAWGGSVPASVDGIARYLTDQAQVVSASTLTRRLVSIGRAHTSQNLPNPCENDLIRATLRGIRRVHGTAVRQVAPAVREDILLMVNRLQGIKGLRDRALLLIGFAGAFRRSELVALTVSDLDFVDRGLVITLRRSKTDQEGIGRKIAVPFARGAICPVQSLRHWLTTSGITDGPVFRPVTRHSRIEQIALSGHAVAQIVKDRAREAGLDSAKYSGHSLRAGLITSAAEMGVSIWKIKVLAPIEF